MFRICIDCFASMPSTAAVTPENNEMNAKLMVALAQKKELFRLKFNQEMSFTRVLLKLGTVRSFMMDMRVVFEERDTDKNGHMDMCEMADAMKALKVVLSEGEVKSLFEMADFYEDNQLTMKQFLVVIAVGFVLDAIPDLLESHKEEERQGANDTTSAGRRHSNFHSKESTVRDALELFTYAYLLFDKDCKGVIRRDEVNSVIAENGQKDTGSMTILSQERWDEMDWDSNGDISFGEFVYAFTKWADFENGDEDTIEGRPSDGGRRQSEIARQGGKARRKSSTSIAGRTTVKAKEIGRRISSAFVTGSTRSSDDSSVVLVNSSKAASSAPSPAAARAGAPCLKVEGATGQKSPVDRKRVAFPDEPDIAEGDHAPAPTLSGQEL